jgi:hypothetical protein
VNKRILFAALALIFFGTLVQSQEPEYYIKVAGIDKTKGEIEGKFITVPEDLRIVCHGDVRKFNEGDYTKLYFRNGNFTVGDAQCTSVRWVK